VSIHIQIVTPDGGHSIVYEDAIVKVETSAGFVIITDDRFITHSEKFPKDMSAHTSKSLRRKLREMFKKDTHE
jgi:hypothetical protein